jgi:hypothetical protein
LVPYLFIHIGKTSILSYVESTRKWSVIALVLLLKTSDCFVSSCKNGTQVEGDKRLTHRDRVGAAKLSSSTKVRKYIIRNSENCRKNQWHGIEQ